MSNSKSPTFLKQPVNMNENSNHAPLSPSAGAVLDAFEKRSLTLREWMDGKGARLKLAAALRAAADQVVPKSEVMPQQDPESRREAMIWGMVNQTQVTRQQLFAIAAELNGTQPLSENV